MRTAVTVAVLATLVACGGGNDGPPAPAVDVGPIALRRLTTEQYARSVRDVLGHHITVPSRIDPDDRRNGLRAVGSSFVGVTPSGFEKYEAAATEIADQALDADHRGTLLPCMPASSTEADNACARQFIEQTGRRLFRRTLIEDEVQSRVDIAAATTQQLGDFYEGVKLALTSLLVSPEFLFRVEETEPGTASGNSFRLTGNTVASRLSYLLWNTTPDDVLLEAVQNGELSDNRGVRAQVERMAADPRSETGIRAFFTDLYDFQSFDDGLVRKDATLFPAFSLDLANDAKEQTLRTIVAHLSAGNDYRDLFTTRDTFVTRGLGLVYQVPVVGEVDGWAPFTFAEDSPRAGLLTQASFLMLHSHPGRSSPTLRGKFVREVILCGDVPTPPANIDFSIVENTDGPLKTARERLERHVVEPSCASCHSLVDPIGLAFETFDPIGSHRTTENGATIDASGDLDGEAYTDAVGMGRALRDHPDLGLCLVRNLYRYAVGREPEVSENQLLLFLSERFEESGYQVLELLGELAATDGFTTTSGPREAEGGTP